MATYQEALDETLKAIDEGAYPLHLDPETYFLLRGRYEDDFRKAFKDFPEGWIGSRGTILDLARLVGGLASAMTTAHCAMDTQGDLKFVMKEHADLAGYTVSKLTPGCAPGKYCENYKLDGYGDRQQRVGLAATMLIKAVTTAVDTLTSELRGHQSAAIA